MNKMETTPTHSLEKKKEKLLSSLSREEQREILLAILERQMEENRKLTDKELADKYGMPYD